MQWHRTLYIYLACLSAAAFVHLFWGSPLGWIALSIGAGVMMTLRRYQAHRVALWAKTPSESPPPADVGPWEPVVNALYKHSQEQEALLNESIENTTAVMAAAQALPVGVIALDHDLAISWFNRAARDQLNLNESKDIGQIILNLIRHPDFLRYSKQATWPEPVVIKQPNGASERLLMLQMVTYLRHQRLLITRDLTQIDRLETTRRDFVANVSHELRTPLTVLAGFLETIIEAPEGAIPEPQRMQYLQLMQSQATRMQTLVADLLTLSDLETSPQADQALVDVAHLLHTAIEQGVALSDGRHEIKFDIDPDLKLLGAASELASAFSNLITNAIRYTPEGGKIKVRWCRTPDGKARYSVKDTGIGISPEHLPRLSERFYRVDRSRSRDVGGTGLGLAITKHIAMRHDATLEIESRLGKGSTFSLSFDARRIAAAVN